MSSNPTTLMLLEDDEVLETSLGESIDSLPSPRIVIPNAKFDEEFEFISKYFVGTKYHVPLYVQLEGQRPVYIADFEVNLESLLLLRFLGYEPVWHRPDGTATGMDDPEQYYKFIRL
jgi:hypothetical protein